MTYKLTDITTNPTPALKNIKTTIMAEHTGNIDEIAAVSWIICSYQNKINSGMWGIAKENLISFSCDITISNAPSATPI